MTHVSRLCLVSVMLCVLGAPARAQDADTRQGGWLGLGLGYGLARLRDAGGVTVATGGKQQLVLVEFMGRFGPEPPAARVHAHARILNRAFPRTGTCPAAVTVFDTPSEVGKPYVEVAQISPSRDGSREPTPEQVDEAERNKAAELGANGMILNHIAGSREVLYDDALAIFIAADSALAGDACVSDPTPRSWAKQ
jgi:hypothetical protein